MSGPQGTPGAEAKQSRVRRTVLFACGVFFGLILGFYALVDVRDAVTFIAGMIAFGAIGGFLSARFGIRFWETISHFRWVPWP